MGSTTFLLHRSASPSSIAAVQPPTLAAVSIGHEVQTAKTLRSYLLHACKIDLIHRCHVWSAQNSNQNHRSMWVSVTLHFRSLFLCNPFIVLRVFWSLQSDMHLLALLPHELMSSPYKYISYLVYGLSS
jgi:hypothetical protein